MFTQSPDFRRLASDLVGQLIVPDTPDYESARRVWNGMIDKRPRAIVRCGNADDVIAAVAFAKDKQMTVAVRGGGHNIAGNATCDDGLVIDLSSMKSIHIDPTSRRARAEGGCLWGEFDAATQAFGLATRCGANVWKSMAKRSISSIIGLRRSASYCSLRALNQSRSLCRLSARRKASASGLNRNRFTAAPEPPAAASGPSAPAFDASDAAQSRRSSSPPEDCQTILIHH